MIDPLSVFIGLVVGAMFGVIVTCLMCIAGENSRMEERRHEDA